MGATTILSEFASRTRIADISAEAVAATKRHILDCSGVGLAATIEAPRVEDDDEVLARLEPSAAGRLALYQIGISEVGARPILGYGPDNFVVGVPTYRPERAPEIVRQNVASSAHSWVIHVATSSGLVG